MTIKALKAIGEYFLAAAIIIGATVGILAICITLTPLRWIWETANQKRIA